MKWLTLHRINVLFNLDNIKNCMYIISIFFHWTHYCPPRNNNEIAYVKSNCSCVIQFVIISWEKTQNKILCWKMNIDILITISYRCSIFSKVIIKINKYRWKDKNNFWNLIYYWVKWANIFILNKICLTQLNQNNVHIVLLFQSHFNLF